MIERLRRIAPELLVAALAVAAALFVAGRALGDGFPLDDAWIHLQYGLELRKSGTLAYNDGIASTGATSPLWAACCAIAHLFAGASGPSMTAAAWSKGFGVALHALTAVLSCRLARACVVRRGWATPAALGAGGIVATVSVLDFAAVSGMEVALTSALLVGAALASVRGRVWLAGALGGVAAIARPECVVVVPAIVAVVAVQARGRAGLMRGVKTLGAALLPIAALVARNLAVSKLPLPATFYVKATPEAQTLAIALRAGFVDLLGKTHPTSRVVFWALVAGAIVLGAIAFARRVRKGGRPSRSTERAFATGAFALAGMVYLVGVAAINVVRNPSSFYYQRYFAPPLPLLIVAAVCATIALAAFVARAVAPSRRTLIVVLPALLFIAAIVDDVLALPAPRVQYADDVRSINALQVTTGMYVRDHVSPNGVVWTVDAGAVRYWGGHRTVDLARLNTREAFHGTKLPKEWWPEAIVTIPEVFQAFAPDGLLDVGISAQSPVAATEAERRQWRHEVYVCRKNANEHPDNRVLVLLYGSELIAVGRCAPK